MKELYVVVFVTLLVVSTAFSQGSYQALYEKFVRYRDSYDVQDMKNLIDELEKLADKDCKLYTLLADAYVEYTLWGAPDDVDKKAMYEKAIEYADKAIELNENYAYAYFVKGAAIGRLAQYAGIVKSLFLLGDFDKSLKKAIELNPKCFRAYVAMGMRYRDVPWPMRSYKKAEEYLKKAIEIEPKYINSYLELGILYEVWNKRDKAIEMFEKVLEMPPMKGFTALGLEAKETAKEHLKKLK
ncbi:MAG: hypothetical protein J7L34_07520 [Thermotogaceae bacterium]|nr:hypothetical protein [Thermotogaceae bacterium]